MTSSLTTAPYCDVITPNRAHWKGSTPEDSCKKCVSNVSILGIGFRDAVGVVTLCLPQHPFVSLYSGGTAHTVVSIGCTAAREGILLRLCMLSLYFAAINV